MLPDRQTEDKPELVRRIVEAAAIEIIPMRSAAEKLQAVPTTSTVTVTCSPKVGIDATLELAAAAAARGNRVVPHIAARQVSGAAELSRIVAKLDALGIRDLYVIAGDAPEPAGDFTSSAELLEALSRMSHPFQSLGVGCYPEGHPKIPGDVLLAELVRKQDIATYMVSQLCFDPATVMEWLKTVRAAGVRLPLRLGLAAPLKTRKLVELSLRIGVGSSIKFLTKQKGFVGNMLVGNTYKPEQLLDEMSDALVSEEMDIAGLHLFSFNQVQDTVAWQRAVVSGSTTSNGE